MARRKGDVPIDRVRVAEMTRLKYSASEIASAIGCSRRQIQRIRTDLKIAQPQPPHAGVKLEPTSERYKAAKALADDGASIGEISRTLHMHKDTVGKYFPHAKQDPGEWMHLWGQIRNKPHLRKLFDEMGGIT